MGTRKRREAAMEKCTVRKEGGREGGREGAVGPTEGHRD